MKKKRGQLCKYCNDI